MAEELALPAVFRACNRYFILLFAASLFLFFIPRPVVSADLKLLAKPKILAVEMGKASYYGGKFHGRKTASGSIFDKDDFIAAHPYYPFGTIVLAIQRLWINMIVD